MYRTAVLVVGLAVALGLGALAVAQDATPPADEACPSPGAGTPAASPEAMAGATPEASPAACPPADGDGEAMTIEMVDIAFNPDTLTIPADTDVTIELPNNGAAIHNFNIDAKNNPSDPGIQSGDVAPGASTTVTVNLPAGEWYFYCAIPGHEAAGMFGTLTVQ